MQSKFVLVVVLISMLTMSPAVFAHEAKGGNAEHHARVGALFSLSGKLEVTKPGPFEVRFHAERLEDGADILSLKSRSLDGSYQFAMQFFDGAEHEVTISLIDPSTQAVLVERKTKVEVEGLHPPMFIKVKTMAFLMIVIAIGMISGVLMTKFRKVVQPLEGGHPHGV